MEEQEVNKVIAEFMGFSHFESGWAFRFHNIACGDKIANQKMTERKEMTYTHSLDALVPVWEKLQDVYSGYDTVRLLPIEKTADFIVWQSNFWEGNVEHHSDGETIQLAAATATVKAILELKKNK